MSNKFWETQSLKKIDDGVLQIASAIYAGRTSADPHITGVYAIENNDVLVYDFIKNRTRIHAFDEIKVQGPHFVYDFSFNTYFFWHVLRKRRVAYNCEFDFETTSMIRLFLRKIFGRFGWYNDFLHFLQEKKLISPVKCPKTYNHWLEIFFGFGGRR